MLRTLALLIIIAAATTGLPAQTESSRDAEDAEVRTWTSRDGKHTTRASYAGFQAGKVRLVKADSAAVEVPLISLSKTDQRYVRQIAKDDAEAVEILTRQKADLKTDDKGRVVEAVFAPNSRVGRRDFTLLSGLSNLERLGLAQTRIADEALEEIKHLSISNTRVSPQGVLRLRKSLPNTDMAGSGVVRRR